VSARTLCKTRHHYYSPLHPRLVYTKPLDSVFRALWLATQTRDSICYSFPGIVLDFARQFFLISQEKKNYFGAGYRLLWYVLKQIFSSVSAKSGRYLPTLTWKIVIYYAAGTIIDRNWRRPLHPFFSFAAVPLFLCHHKLLFAKETMHPLDTWSRGCQSSAFLAQRDFRTAFLKTSWTPGTH